MASSSTTAEVKASVVVHPARSQVFLVAIAVLSAIATICGTALLSFSLMSGLVLVGFAVILMAGAGYIWMKSQSDIDLHDAHPTKFALPDGTSVSTDTRMLRSPDALNHFARLIQEVACRRPLPDPIGLVDAKNQPIPNSRDAALDKARKINSETQAFTNDLIDTLGLSGCSASERTQQVTAGSDAKHAEELPQDMNTVFNMEGISSEAPC